VEKAYRRVGAGTSFATVFGYRTAAVDAKSARIRAMREQVFNAGMAKTFAWAHHRRGACAYRLNDYATAVTDATAAMTFNSSDAWLYNLRGEANEALKKREDALADFTRSIELEPAVSGFWFARAYARVTMSGTPLSPTKDGAEMNAVYFLVPTGDVPLIDADLRRTLELEPAHELAKAMLQHLVQSRRRAPEAAGQLESRAIAVRAKNAPD
jgi:tetratricopeptide (TPR) repeat protein